MIVKWTSKLKERFGYLQSKDCYIVDKSCFDKECFRPHDWNHDGHLVCWMNAQHGCPENNDVRKSVFSDTKENK